MKMVGINLELSMSIFQMGSFKIERHISKVEPVYSSLFAVCDCSLEINFYLLQIKFKKRMATDIDMCRLVVPTSVV